MARAAAKKPARKGASRNKAPAARKGPPGWLWLAAGLLLGAFVAFLWHLWELRKDAARLPAAAATAPATGAGSAVAAGEAPADGKPATEEQRFEFYTLLPNQEVMPGSKPAPAQPEAKPDEAGPSILLQAGSFRSEAEADKRRAAILLLGMPVKVVKVGSKPDDTWYRVVVGPFKGKDAAASARTSLKGNGVDSVVMKRG